MLTSAPRIVVLTVNVALSTPIFIEDTVPLTDTNPTFPEAVTFETTILIPLLEEEVTVNFAPLFIVNTLPFFCSINNGYLPEV